MNWYRTSMEVMYWYVKYPRHLRGSGEVGIIMLYGHYWGLFYAMKEQG